MENPKVKKVFDDLDDYKRFCVVFGWPYNEADLYQQSAPAYAEYTRFKNGTRIPNNWMKDSKWRLSRFSKSHKKRGN